MNSQQQIKEQYFLDPGIVFLNHGSYGACPRPVFEKYQEWQRRLELQPVQFLGVELDELLRKSRQALGEYLHTPAVDLAYIPNATHGVNIVARSLKLERGDEILTSDHEYGACNFAWEFICGKTGASYKQQPIHLPVSSSNEILEQFWQGVTPQTKVIFLSHIASPTSLTIPIRQVCERARLAGILTVIDGAHAPGQLDLDLPALSVDFYTGNCHKWMMSPKGSGFLYVRPEVQQLIEPLIVSWGYQSISSTPRESQFIDLLQWTGTKDPSAVLSVPVAIEFMMTNDWKKVRVNCHNLLRSAMQRICDQFEVNPLYPYESDLYAQMGTVPIPQVRDIVELKNTLYEAYKIEIPCLEWNGRHFIRISVQGYNSEDDIDHLINALKQTIPSLRT